jgi:maltose/moltooligosaccharide transporter
LKNFLDNDPGKAISFAGVLLLIAAGATLLIKTKKAGSDENVLIDGGH